MATGMEFDLSALRTNRVLARPAATDLEGVRAVFDTAGARVRMREGDHGFAVAQVAVGDVRVCVAALPPANIEHFVSRDVTIVGFMIDDLCRLVYNGERYADTHVSLSHAGSYDSSYFTSADAPLRMAASLVFPGDNADRGWPRAGSLSRVLPVEAARLARLRRTVVQILQVANHAPERFDDPIVTAAMTTELYARVDDLMPSQFAALPSRPADRHVERLAELLSSSDFRRLSVADVAERWAVSERTVQSVFHKFYGMSAHACLKSIRLHEVRRAIVTAPNHVLIKQCALEHGFWHMGQFSRDYRAQFGETPIETKTRHR